MSTELLDKVRYWSEHQCFDSETRDHAKRMLQENNQKEIEECFKSVLEFGTGGLRGPMGIGTNRICLLYTSPSPRDATLSRMPSSA